MSMQAVAGELFYPSIENAPTGGVGVFAVRVVLGATTVIARDEDAIIETAAGVYRATRTAPAQPGSGYQVIWDFGDPDDPEGTFSEDLLVLGIQAYPTTYATIADLRAYTSLATDLDDDALQLALDHAERDVDGVLIEPVPWGRQPTGLKYDPTALEGWRAAALNRATCAQAEYRLEMGEEFFIRAQHVSERGPDFAVNGQLPHIGPKVYRELAGAALVATPGVGQLTVGGTIMSSSTGWVDTNAD